MRPICPICHCCAAAPYAGRFHARGLIAFGAAIPVAGPHEPASDHLVARASLAFGVTNCPKRFVEKRQLKMLPKVAVPSLCPSLSEGRSISRSGRRSADLRLVLKEVVHILDRGVILDPAGGFFRDSPGLHGFVLRWHWACDLWVGPSTSIATRGAAGSVRVGLA